MNIDDFRINPKELSDEELLEKLLKIREQITNLYSNLKLLKAIPDAQILLSFRNPDIDIEELFKESIEEIGKWEEIENVLKAEVLERMKK